VARVVVVGAGLGGLAVAARLATQGHAVTICEQAPQVGGKLGIFAKDGFVFDTGPSLLTLPAVYRDLFLATGAPLGAELRLEPVDPVFTYRFADGARLTLPNGPRSRIARAWDDAAGRGAGDDWSRLMTRAGDVWDATRDRFLSSPLDGPRTLLAQARHIRDLRTVAPWRTLRELGREYLRSPYQRTVLDRYATYTGSDPRRAPAALVTVPYVEQTFGAWYVRGGLHRLGEAVLARALDRGASVRVGAPVTEILLDEGRHGVTGVRLADGERIAGDVVVANADAAAVYRDLLPAPVGARPLRALRRARPSLSGFVLLLALRGRTRGMGHHTVLFPQDYDEEFDSVFGTGRHAGTGTRPVPDPTVYISAPDDPALRPDDDSEAWFVLVNAPRQVRAGEEEAAGGRGVDWDAAGLRHEYADRVLSVMADRGLNVRDRIVWREIRTPADLERDTGSVGGSIYGSSSDGVRAAFLRPANRSPVPGLFLVGGSSHPGGGLPLVGLSAAIVAELIGPA
jgi:phytoene desaturase